MIVTSPLNEHYIKVMPVEMFYIALYVHILFTVCPEICPIAYQVKIFPISYKMITDLLLEPHFLDSSIRLVTGLSNRIFGFMNGVANVLAAEGSFTKMYIKTRSTGGFLNCNLKYDGHVVTVQFAQMFYM